jgi:sugar/nucleoside kinase (ribokinase family)
VKLLVVGSVALDTIESPAGRVEEALGGSAAFFAAAASYFAPVRLVATVGEDFAESHLDRLRARGIDLEGLSRAPGRTFRWAGRYSEDLQRRETLFTELGVFEDFRPTLPESYRDADLVFLGNIDPELQADVLAQVKNPSLVAADTMNFWIAGKPRELERVLTLIQVLLINDEEARQLAREHNLVRAVARIQTLGPRTVIVKRGDSGALMLGEDGPFVVPAFPLHDVVDPTGAGDSFAGGFMGELARRREHRGRALRAAAVAGAALGSFCVEGLGMDRLLRLDREEVVARVGAVRDLMRVEG